jgi:glycosyltransferase involved in cell wall biosynthesis
MFNILFVGTYPTQPIGYSKIANKISNYIAELPNIKLYYFGFGNFTESIIYRQVHPNIQFIDVIQEEKINGTNDLYGVNIFQDTIIKINPNLIFMYNDIIVLSRLMNQIINYRINNKQLFKIITYVDLVYDFERPLYIQHIFKNSDMVLVFSEHWKKNLKIMNLNEKKINVLYHGFNDDIFYKQDTNKCKKILHLSQDNFIILNANRNTYRKAQDITIAAFLLFLKKQNFNSNIKLLLHCDSDAIAGYDILNIIEVECMKLNIDNDLIVNNHILKLSNLHVNDNIINILYNACDIGINTCIGEGFGLCNMEHAILGKPQIVSNVGAFKDIFKNITTTVEPICSYQISNHTDYHNGVAYICNPQDFAEKMNDIYLNYEQYQNEFQNFGENIKSKYDWNKIKEELYKYIMEVIEYPSLH